MADRKLTLRRIQEMLDRQFPPRWEREYIPAQLATSAEKPSITKASSFYSSKLGRYMHAVASTELPFITLALMHPALFDLKEQWVLPPTPYAHPLVGHPLAAGMLLPSTTGTVAIAARLGLAKLHPRILVKGRVGAAPAEWCAALLPRDILLFLVDEQGPYCVDWDVKRNKGDHGKPGPGPAHQQGNAGKLRSAAAKDAIYLECLGELAIRPVRLASVELPRNLRNNLNRLAFAHAKTIELLPVQVEMALDQFQEAIVKGIPANEVIDDLGERGVPHEQAQIVLDQGVWTRQLRIDLFSYWVNSEPMEPEKQHPLEVYADWFRRLA